jgi:chromosome segregation ATPase
VPKDSARALNWYRRAARLPELTFEVLPSRTSIELQQLRTQIAELRSQLQTKRAELDRAQGELDAQRRRVEDSRRTAEAERANLVQLRKEIQDQKDMGQTTTKLDELQKSVAERARLDARGREVAALRASLARAEGDSRALRNTLARETGALRERLAGAEAESSAQRPRIEGLTQHSRSGATTRSRSSRNDS